MHTRSSRTPARRTCLAVEATCFETTFRHMYRKHNLHTVYEETPQEHNSSCVYGSYFHWYSNPKTHAYAEIGIHHSKWYAKRIAKMEKVLARGNSTSRGGSDVDLDHRHDLEKEPPDLPRIECRRDQGVRCRRRRLNLEHDVAGPVGPGVLHRLAVRAE